MADDTVIVLEIQEFGSPVFLVKWVPRYYNVRRADVLHFSLDANKYDTVKEAMRYASDTQQIVNCHNEISFQRKWRLHDLQTLRKEFCIANGIHERWLCPVPPATTQARCQEHSARNQEPGQRFHGNRNQKDVPKREKFSRRRG